MDHEELQRELKSLIAQNAKLKELFRLGNHNERQLDFFGVNDREIGIAYTAKTHGGGSMVLGSLERELLNFSGRPKEILECFCGPGFFGFWAKTLFPDTRVTFLDINPDVLPLLETTRGLNNFTEVNFYTSNILENCPPRIFDLVLANPPWWPSLNSPEYKLTNAQQSDTPSPISYFDPDFKIHQNFFSQIKNFIHPESQILLLESRYHAKEIITIAEAVGFSVKKHEIDILESLPKEFTYGMPTWLWLKSNG